MAKNSLKIDLIVFLRISQNRNQVNVLQLRFLTKKKVQKQNNSAFGLAYKALKYIINRRLREPF